MRRRICFVLGVVVIFVGVFATTDAKIWQVPEDLEGIQRAIDTCSTAPGVRDTVSVLQGTHESPTIYYEKIDFKGKSLLLSSRPIEDPDPRATVIDGQQQGSVVTFENGEDESAEIRGFTITNGAGKYMESLKDNQLIIVIEDSSISLGKHLGGGILCHSSSPVITNNIISGNSSCPGSGGGIACVSYSSPKISGNEIVDNVGFCGGGIICFLRSAPTIRGNLIKNNTAYCGGTAGLGGGILCDDSCRICIVSCVIDSNHAKWSGGGICVGDTTFVAIDSCDIRYNSCGPSYFDGGGIAAFGAQYGDSITLSNSVVMGNTADIQIPVPNAGGIFLNNWAYANLGDVEIEIPGNNLICDNKDYDLVCLNSTVTKAEGNNWGSVDTDTIQSSIYGSIEFDPIAYSGHIAYNSTCSTGVLITGDVWVDEDVTLNLKGGDITVPSGITLTMQQGAQARFSAGADNQCSGVDTTLSELIVEGDLNAQGTASEPVTFTSTSSNKGDWYGIRVLNGGCADIDYATIEYGDCGVSFDSAQAGDVISCTIKDNLVCGIRGCATANLNIADNTISGNNDYGIYTEDCSPYIIGNDFPFPNQDYAIKAVRDYPDSVMVIRGNTISMPVLECGKSGDGHRGITVEYAAPLIEDNVIVGGAYGIFGVGLDSTTVIKGGSPPQQILDRNVVGLALYSGSRPIVFANQIIDYRYRGVVCDESYPRLGNCLIPETGYNSITPGSCSPQYAVYCEEVTDTIKAEMNWWGQSPPDSSLFHGPVDYDPWLTEPPALFMRGDAETDGVYTMGDGLLILSYYFYGTPVPTCLDACDFDDNGSITMGDGLACIQYYTYGDPLPAPPGTSCGPDPTPDDPYDCVSHDYCMGAKRVTSGPSVSVKGVPNKLVLRQAIAKDGIMRVPVDLIITEDVLGCAFLVEYDASKLSFVGLAGGEGYDFYASHVVDEASGLVRVGCIPDLELKDVFAPGEHRVAELEFKVKDMAARVEFGLDEVAVYNTSVATIPVEWIDDGLMAKAGSDNLPKEFDLRQNYPNPFNPFTLIKYDLPVDCQVRLDVYNVVGQRVATLVDGQQKAGYKTARWDAGSLSSGIYFYRLEAGDFVQTRKMVLIR